MSKSKCLAASSILAPAMSAPAFAQQEDQGDNAVARANEGTASSLDVSTSIYDVLGRTIRAGIHFNY
jgi:hypothetical protein